jgi:2-haloacid dehalogenase
MSTVPAVIVFDVNETLSDLAPLTARFAEVGAPGFFAQLWFTTLLRDGFALAASGDSAPFGVIGADLLRGLLDEKAVQGEVKWMLDRSVDDAVAYVMAGLGELSLHPDVAPGIRSLKTAGFRLLTLSNGPTKLADTMLSTAGLRNEFEALLTVDDAPAWKPVRSAYEHAANAAGVQPEDMLLVAVHPWDIHGAARAGLHTAWLNRAGALYPRYFEAPDYTVRALPELAVRLAAADEADTAD